MVWFNTSGPILNKGLSGPQPNSSPHLIPPVHSNCFPVLRSSATAVPTVSLYQGHGVPWVMSMRAPQASASLFVPLIGGCGPKEEPVYWRPSLPLLVAEESRTCIFSQYQGRFWPSCADHQANPGLRGPRRALSVLWMSNRTSPRTGGFTRHSLIQVFLASHRVAEYRLAQSSPMAVY